MKPCIALLLGLLTLLPFSAQAISSHQDDSYQNQDYFSETDNTALKANERRHRQQRSRTRNHSKNRNRASRYTHNRRHARKHNQRNHRQNRNRNTVRSSTRTYSRGNNRATRTTRSYQRNQHKRSTYAASHTRKTRRNPISSMSNHAGTQFTKPNREFDTQGISQNNSAYLRLNTSSLNSFGRGLNLPANGRSRHPDYGNNNGHIYQGAASGQATGTYVGEWTRHCGKRKCGPRYANTRDVGTASVVNLQHYGLSGSGNGLVNGITVNDPNQFPFAVSIMDYNGHVCGGTLITQNMVLTAAHCFIVPASIAYVPDLTVAVGDVTPDGLDSQTGVRIPVSEFIPHPRYGASSHSHDLLTGTQVAFDNDVAILVLSQNVPSHIAQPITFAAQPDGMYEFVGIGWDQPNSPDAQQQFAYFINEDFDGTFPTTTSAINTHPCIDQFGNSEAHQSAICATATNDSDPLLTPGDSGSGAIVYQNGQPVLIGVASFRSNNSTFWQSMDNVMDWVQAVINGEDTTRFAYATNPELSMFQINGQLSQGNITVGVSHSDFDLENPSYVWSYNFQVTAPPSTTLMTVASATELHTSNARLSISNLPVPQPSPTQETIGNLQVTVHVYDNGSVVDTATRNFGLFIPCGGGNGPFCNDGDGPF